VIILEHDSTEIHQRALTLFATKAKQAVGARGELSIRITSSAEMRKLNLRFRRKNKPTDVLSFPADMPEFAGDIAISAEIAAANAGQLGHSVDTELKILILHGLLHLAGYDHETDAGEMQAKEVKLRRRLSLPVGLIERTNGTSLRARRRKVASTVRQDRRR
jgi:probable rRNA maturation factor